MNNALLKVYKKRLWLWHIKCCTCLSINQGNKNMMIVMIIVMSALMMIFVIMFSLMDMLVEMSDFMVVEDYFNLTSMHFKRNGMMAGARVTGSRVTMDSR